VPEHTIRSTEWNVNVRGS